MLTTARPAVAVAVLGPAGARRAGLAVRVVLVAGIAALLSGLWMGQALAAPVGAANEAGVSPAAAASGRLSASGYHSCAIKTDGTPVCWGDNGDGETSVPAGTGALTAISAGGYHTCAITTDGTPVCWGDNGFGQASVPPGTGTVTAMTAGKVH